MGSSSFFNTNSQYVLKPALSATSTSPVTIGGGIQTFTIDSGKSFLPGAYLIIANTANPTLNYMTGIVSSYDGTTLVVSIDTVVGSGTYAAWTIQLAGVSGAASSYTLPTASPSVLGGVKVDGTTITIAGGVISAVDTPYTLPTASTTVLGGVKVDGTTITISSGVISSVGGGGSGSPGGTPGQLQYNNAGAFGGFTLGGDATVNPATGALTIANGAVSLPKMANLAASTILGNNTVSAATPIALTPAQTKTLLALTASDVGLGSVDNTSDASKTATLLAAAHTWASTQTFTTAPAFTDAAGTRTALDLAWLSRVATKTLTLNNTLTLAGTDGSTLNVGAGGTLGTGAFAAAYSLPTASTTVLGGVKVDGTTITISSGVISSVGGGGSTAPLVLGTNVVDQRNGTNQQNFNVYGTYTDASNYCRLNIGAVAAGTFQIFGQSAGTGALSAIKFGYGVNDWISFNGSGIQVLAAGVNVLSYNVFTTGWSWGSNFTPANVTMSTIMTTGFMNMVGAAGPPTGVPSDSTNGCPFYYDKTNDKIYVYNGAWKSTAALT